MSRVTAPVSKLARTLSAAPIPSQNAGAVLMPKYADLLRNRRSSEHSDTSRGLTTTHRPTPQPSIANRAKPLMQTFHSSAGSAAPVSHLDSAVLPFISEASASQDAGIRVPLLPDNYTAQHAPYAADAPVTLAEISIVAANPDNVMPAAALSEVEGMGLDGIELKFIHESAPEAKEPGMLTDIWRGIVDDVLGAPKKPAF